MSIPDSTTSVTGVISLLQEDPLNVEKWQRLANYLNTQKDSLSARSLETIIDGLKQFHESSTVGEADFAPQLTPAHNALFIRLATSYNDPKIFRDIGKIYLNQWRLPQAARRHFDRALRLGGSETELMPLIEGAALAVRTSAQGGTAKVHTGLRDGHHPHPIVTEVVQTGRLQTAKREAISAPLPPPRNKTREALPDSTKDCLKEADALLAQGALDQAFALLHQANEKPEQTQDMRQAWARVGIAYYEQGAYREMEEANRWAMHYGPKNFVSVFNLGLAQQLMQKYEEAEATYLIADQLQPNQAKVWCNLGAIYFQRSLYEKAEAASLKAIEIRHDYARAWDNLASALGAQNKLDAALEACQQALAIQPDYPEPYFKMGMIYFGRNSLTKATHAFQQCLSPVVMAPYAHAFLAIIHARMENVEQSALSLKTARDANPQCELLLMAWNELGHAQYTLGDYESAVVSYQAATFLGPAEFGPWLHLGLAHHAMGNLVQAQENYQKALERNPKSYSAWHNLGITYAEQGLDAEATVAFQNEVKIETISARAWYDLGVSLDREGRTKEAQEAFGNAEAFAKLGYN